MPSYLLSDDPVHIDQLVWALDDGAISRIDWAELAKKEPVITLTLIAGSGADMSTVEYQEKNVPRWQQQQQMHIPYREEQQNAWESDEIERLIVQANLLEEDRETDVQVESSTKAAAHSRNRMAHQDRLIDAVSIATKIGPTLLPALGALIGALLTARFGRKMKVKIGDTEVEATSEEEIVRLLRLARRYSEQSLAKQVLPR